MFSVFLSLRLVSDRAGQALIGLGWDKKDEVLAVVTAAAWEPGNLSPPPSLNHFLLRKRLSSSSSPTNISTESQMEFAMVPDPLVTGELKKRVCQARMEGSLSHSVPHWNLKCQSVAVTGSYSLIFYNSSRSKIPQGLFPLFLHLSVVGGGNFLAPPPPPLPPSPPLPPPPPLQSPE